MINPIDIQEELLAPSFGSHRLKSVTSYTHGMLINLTVDQVVAYDKNPRREINPEYEQIKASISKRGMDQVLSVTQRPDDPPDIFMIIHGGNTRLLILQELYIETKKDRFKTLQCRYVAWNTESDALIGHLIENDARGDYSFIDRAIGILNTKQELEKESKKSLSSRKLIEVMKEQGYKLSRADLFRMIYAVNFLYPVIPKALDANIGPSQIDAIKKLDKYALDLYLELKENNATPEDWEQLFTSALTPLNTAQWSHDALYAEVLLLLANNDSIEANRLSFILSGRLEGLERSHHEELVKALPVSDTDNSVEKNTPTPRQQPSDTNNKKDDSNNTVHTTSAISSAEQSSNNPTGRANNTDTQEVNNTKNETEADVSLSEQALFIPPSVAPLPETTPKQLRAKIFTLALTLASNNGFGELVGPLPFMGSGFIIKDLLSETYLKGEQLFGSMKKRPYKERIMVWWMLLGFSELRIISINNPTDIAELIPDGDLKRALFNGESNPQDKRRMALSHIFNRTGEFIIDDLSVYFWAVASEKNLAQVQELQILYRQLNEVLDFNLWEMPS